MNESQKKLQFRPYSEKEVNEILESVPDLEGKIRKFKVNSWINTSTLKVNYGLACQVKNGTWFTMSKGLRPLIFEKKKLANIICKHYTHSLKVPFSSQTAPAPASGTKDGTI